MAELILTQAETDALSWLDLDDDALGKVVRKGLIDITSVADEQDHLTSMVAAYALVGLAVQTNADELDINLGGVTHADRAVGDWSIKVRLHSTPEGDQTP